MRINNLSLSERKKLALKLKEDLERDGFNTIWSDETTIQVEDLAIPKIVQFDIANLIISVQEYHIYFAIIIKFIKVLEDLTDAEEINKVCDLHNNKWLIELTSYFSSIDPSSKLEWDTMYGFLDTVDEAIPFIHNLRKLIDYETEFRR